MQHRTFPRLGKPIVERFWKPFTQNIVGADVTKYPFMDAIRDIATPNGFTCQINGAIGGTDTLEDFFVIVLSGFDVAAVNIAAIDVDAATARGAYTLMHSRSFLGWKPTEEPIRVPFTMRIESCCHANRASHITLRTPLAEALEAAGCPPEVAASLNNADAMRMLVALRRARVKPDIISLKALMSASKRQDTWCSALGIL